MRCPPTRISSRYVVACVFCTGPIKVGLSGSRSGEWREKEKRGRERKETVKGRRGRKRREWERRERKYGTWWRARGKERERKLQSLFTPPAPINLPEFCQLKIGPRSAGREEREREKRERREI